MALVSATASYANEIRCTSADQNLQYSHKTSNGGAPLDLYSLTYQKQTQIASPYSQGTPLDWKLVNQKNIDQQTSGSTVITTSVGFATGTIQLNNQSIPFSEWVICSETASPACRLCP